MSDDNTQNMGERKLLRCRSSLGHFLQIHADATSDDKPWKLNFSLGTNDSTHAFANLRNKYAKNK